MQIHDLTTGLQAVLLHFQRGYVLTTECPIVVHADKRDSLMEKFIEVYGVNFPAWKRYSRKLKGLPSAVALDLSVLGQPHSRQIVLLSTAFDDRLPKDAQWRREKWVPLKRVQDFVLSNEVGSDRQTSLSWRLAPEVIAPQARYWLKLIKEQKASEAMMHMREAVELYPAYAGVRKQLKQEISSLKKLIERKYKVPYTGPDPDKLPIIAGFRKATGNSKTEASPAASKAPAPAASKGASKPRSANRPL